MNLWIEIARDSLVAAIESVDCLILNDAELRQLTGKPNLVSAAREILSWGPSVIVAKQGEYGAALITRESFFALPAYPLETVDRPDRRRRHVRRRLRRLHRREPRRRRRHVAASGELSDELLRRAMAYATVLASFNVEQFGTERVQTLTRAADRRARRRAARDHAVQRRRLSARGRARLCGAGTRVYHRCEWTRGPSSG